MIKNRNLLLTETFNVEEVGEVDFRLYLDEDENDNDMFFTLEFDHDEKYTEKDINLIQEKAQDLLEYLSLQVENLVRDKLKEELEDD
jgi:hypothetical protein